MENFTTNLNQLARVGGIDPLIGRDKELERAIQCCAVDARTTRCWWGESGVGKTAIAEGLASAHCAGRRAGSDCRLHHLLARHRLAAGGHQISW